MASILTGTTAVAPPPSDRAEEHYEVIDGQRVELPPMSFYATAIASRLVSRLNDFAWKQDLGEAFSEGLFRLPLPQQRNRRPDVAFVSYQRWPKGQPIPEEDHAWDVVPDLAVEVISSTDLAEDLLARIEEYFQAGVQLVWVVYPRRRIVHVYESLTQIRVRKGNDELDGGNVLPAFRLPLSALFG
ncbi:MAG TPA: Uma2 family endonuclease [Gemmataceae bacterium]|nr:Uma2 family endonuclease [Gemmataceae bacterium]